MGATFKEGRISLAALWIPYAEISTYQYNRRRDPHNVLKFNSHSASRLHLFVGIPMTCALNAAVATIFSLLVLGLGPHALLRTRVYFLMELVSGGELLDSLDSLGLLKHGQASGSVQRFKKGLS